MGTIFGLILGVPKVIVVLLLLGLLAGGMYCAPGWVEQAKGTAEQARDRVQSVRTPGSEVDISIEGELNGTGVGVEVEKRGDTITLSAGKTVIPPDQRTHGLRARASMEIRTPTPIPPEAEAILLWSANMIEGEDMPVIEIETGKVFQIRIIVQMDNGTYQDLPEGTQPRLEVADPDRLRLDGTGKVLAPYDGETILKATAGFLSTEAKVMAKGGPALDIQALTKLVIDPERIDLSRVGEKARVRVMGEYGRAQELKPLPQEYLPMLKLESKTPHIFIIDEDGMIEARGIGSGSLNVWLLDKRTEKTGTVIVGAVQEEETGEAGTPQEITGTDASFRDDTIVKIQMQPTSIIVTPGEAGSPERIIVTHKNGQETTLGSNSEDVEYELERMEASKIAHWVIEKTGDLTEAMILDENGSVTVHATMNTTSVWLVARYRGHTTRTRLDVRSLGDRRAMAQNQCQDTTPKGMLMVEHQRWTGNEAGWSASALGGREFRVYPEFKGTVIEFPCSGIDDMSNAIHTGNNIPWTVRAYPFHPTPGDNRPQNLEPAILRGQTIITIEEGTSVRLPILHTLSPDGSLARMNDTDSLRPTPVSSDPTIVSIDGGGRSITANKEGNATVLVSGKNKNDKAITVVVTKK